MQYNQLREVMSLAEKRESARYAFHRHMLLLTSGALTVLVSLKPEASANALSVWSLRMAYPALGLGILGLSVALHGEVRALVLLAKECAKMTPEQWSQGMPIVVKQSRLYIASERIAYAALALAVLAFVLFGIARK